MDALEVFKVVMMTLGVLVIPSALFFSNLHTRVVLLKSGLQRAEARLGEHERKFDALHELSERIVGLENKIDALTTIVAGLKQ